MTAHLLMTAVYFHKAEICKWQPAKSAADFGLFTWNQEFMEMSCLAVPSHRPVLSPCRFLK